MPVMVHPLNCNALHPLLLLPNLPRLLAAYTKRTVQISTSDFLLEEIYGEIKKYGSSGSD